MTDITMCATKDCPLANTCYRQTAEPNKFWQSYSDFEKYLNRETKTCDYYYKTTVK